MPKNLFNSVKVANPASSTFDLTHDVKLSLDMGKLIPIMVMDCFPGDNVHISAESLLRFAPMVAPVMHRSDVTMHYFFVAYRLLWPGWEEYITGNALEGPTGPQTPPSPPYIHIGGTETDNKTLLDYLGMPFLNAVTTEIIAFAPAAYQMIYNEFYRDQNLIPEVPFQLINGDNSANVGPLTTLRYRAWEHDYFTAALPYAQKGAAVDIPLAPIGDVPVHVHPLASFPAGNASFANLSAGGGNVVISAENPDASYTDPSMLFADTSSLNASPTTINDLRTAFRLQEWLEKNARGGTRYTESNLVHFGVKSPDARLNRPEYITGSKSPVVISEILNTTGENSGLPQGNMAGHGLSVTSGKQGSYYCQEHGVIIGIMSVLPRTAYQQGIPKHFRKFDALDYAWPSFANLGEQEILQEEIYAQSATPQAVFGYIPRYAEYKYIPSRVAGDFKDTLDFWHLGRIFASDPQLNQAFIECVPDDRIFAVTAGGVDNLYAHVLNKIKATRKLPKYGTPTF